MNRPSRIAAAIASLLAASAQAQTTLSTVNVTAKGYEADAAETPVATSVVGRAQLQRQQSPNVGDALRREPGMVVASDSAQGQNPVIRGLGKERMVLLVDGMRFNSAQPVGAIASFISMGLAERVEVVKGPASVLYGTGALGGAINVQMPQAKFEPGLGLRAQAGFDSASRGLRGAAVGNFSEGDHALMLGLSASKDRDYKAPGGKVAHTGYDSRAFIGQYRYRLDGQQQLRVSAQHEREDDVWYPGSVRRHPLANVVGNTLTHSPRQERTLYEVGYSRRGAVAGEVNVDARVYRQEMHRTIYVQSSLLGRDIVSNDVTFATTGVDARADWLVHPEHLLSAGVNVWRMTASPDSRSARPPQFTQWVPNLPFTDGKVQAAGIYVQDDMHFGPFNVLAGLRHDRVKGSASSINNRTVTTGLNRTDGATSGSLGVIYEADPLLRPYVNVSRAFRAADMRERYQSGARTNGYYYAGSPQIKPEYATQIELGLKGENENLGYQVSVYRNRITDYITGTQLTGQQAVAACGQAQSQYCMKTVNLGHATITGFEAGARWQALPGQWLQAAFTHLHGTNGDYHEPLFQMPADRLSLGWEGKLVAGWSADADLSLVRKQKRVATRFARGLEDPTTGYGVLNVGATWQFAAQQSLRFMVKNVGDKRYHDHLTEGLTGMEPPAPGRALLVSWEGRF